MPSRETHIATVWQLRHLSIDSIRRVSRLSLSHSGAFCSPTGWKLTQKQKDHTASLSTSRWKGKHAAKENLIPPLANAPRATTRAQNCVKTTILDQKRGILVLQQSNSDYESSNASLTMELDIATSRVHTLEAENTALTEGISGMQDELDDAKEVIFAQSGLIKQGKQCINRLMRDKLVLSSRILRDCRRPPMPTSKKTFS
ncbi:hypothetical protein B0H13DRAFT_1933573 [Mycena leptocephala]|nr:hypothetical protein B0H13DRAFT_1933573 [Mycena leptocephala]